MPPLQLRLYHVHRGLGCAPSSRIVDALADALTTSCARRGKIRRMTVERPPIPTEERMPAWRRACLAYREMRQAGASDQEAHEAAVTAVQAKEASAEAVNAIAYAC